MKRPPPYVVRRLVIAPLFVVAAGAATFFLPFWLIGAAFASRYVPGRWRALRVMWFMFLYLWLEALMIIALFALWLVSGFGWKLRSPRFQAMHYRLAGWFLRRVMGSARVTFDVKIDVEHRVGPEVGRLDRPVLVFSRHAGPGDSFLLVDAVLNGHDRRPRIVLKDLLQLDPCIDIALGRLPTRFVPSSGHAGQAVVDAIGELAATMAPDDALVIFPEGGNFTPRRHERAIVKLEEIGRPDLAERARAMRHLLPPKPTGALAAIRAAPNADVVFVGHVGLEQLLTVRDVWRGIPMDTSVTAATWRVRAEDVPPPEERETWLYDQWSVIDGWIAARVPSVDGSGDVA